MVLGIYCFKYCCTLIFYSHKPSQKPTISSEPTLSQPTSRPTIGDNVTFFVTAGFFTRNDLFYDFEFDRISDEGSRFLVERLEEMIQGEIKKNFHLSTTIHVAVDQAGCQIGIDADATRDGKNIFILYSPNRRRKNN